MADWNSDDDDGWGVANVTTSFKKLDVDSSDNQYERSSNSYRYSNGKLLLHICLLCKYQSIAPTKWRNHQVKWTISHQ